MRLSSHTRLQMSQDVAMQLSVEAREYTKGQERKCPLQLW